MGFTKFIQIIKFTLVMFSKPPDCPWCFQILHITLQLILTVYFLFSGFLYNLMYFIIIKNAAFIDCQMSQTINGLTFYKTRLYFAKKRFILSGGMTVWAIYHSQCGNGAVKLPEDLMNTVL